MLSRRDMLTSVAVIGAASLADMPTKVTVSDTSAVPDTNAVLEVESQYKDLDKKLVDDLIRYQTEASAVSPARTILQIGRIYQLSGDSLSPILRKLVYPGTDTPVEYRGEGSWSFSIHVVDAIRNKVKPPDFKSHWSFSMWSLPTDVRRLYAQRLWNRLCPTGIDNLGDDGSILFYRTADVPEIVAAGREQGLDYHTARVVTQNVTVDIDEIDDHNLAAITCQVFALPELVLRAIRHLAYAQTAVIDCLPGGVSAIKSAKGKAWVTGIRSGDSIKEELLNSYYHLVVGFAACNTEDAYTFDFSGLDS